MVWKIRNLGPGDNRYYGTPGLDEIINAGDGSDTVITGGSGYKEVNSGNDRSPDDIYNESLAKFGNPWIGGHVIRNGVADEFHYYHLGAGDESRISLPNWNTNMMNPAKVPGKFDIHGPGTGDDTWIKSMDIRPGAQQLSMAGEEAEVFRFWADTKAAPGGGVTMTITDLWLKGDTDNPASDNQFVHLDTDRFTSAMLAPWTVKAESGSRADMLAAVEGLVDRGSDGIGHDWLLMEG